MSTSTQMKMPEFLVYGRYALSGLVLAEIGRLAFLSSCRFGNWVANEFSMATVATGLALCFAVPFAYGWRRKALDQLRQMLGSRRIDLLLAVAIGVCSDALLSRKLESLHAAVERQEMLWTPLLLCLLLMLMLAPVLRDAAARGRIPPQQVHFLSDDEIQEEGQDLLGVAAQAKEFAETVMTAGSQAGLVFGLDAPWGTGKTSFLNLAERVWSESESIVVVKFETLRYASEPDLSDRFIRDLCTAIKRQAFAPEFAPAADRYSRMLKGKTDVSFLGFKITLEPSAETIDDLLEDIDAVLKQSRKQLVVIIEDLDRLEPKLVNNVLFTIRRTFKLNQAAYILCFDAEVLAAGKEEGGRARDFLEKFITVKLSLFVDGETLQTFLKTDWKKDASRFPLIPADTMFELSGIMHTVAEMVSGKKAHSYAPLLGDLRKLKRLVNAMLLMRLERFDLGRSDFDPRDLVHLVLLHLRYPGLFRQIYAEETEGRKGTFSLQRGDDDGTANLRNDERFETLVQSASLEAPARFLLTQLFDVQVLKFSRYNQPDESVRRTRACFNGDSRNLEKYLKLIVRFVAPTDIETFKLYKETVDAIVAGKRTVKDVMSSESFSLKRGQLAQDEFWRVLVSNSYALLPLQAAEAIDQLIDALPTYASSNVGERSLRLRSVYALATLLDRAGYGAPSGDRIRENLDVREIGQRIFGEPGMFMPSLIERVAAPERGALGWNDLMTFRLVCSADRQGSLHNLYKGLLQFEDPSAQAIGQVPILAVNSLRRLSQTIFKLFKKTYILSRINFFLAVDSVRDDEIYGALGGPQSEDDDIESADVVRSSIKTFVIYQLANDQRGSGAGVGCGAYDEEGTEDNGGIRTVMSRYLLEFCFDPTVLSEHATVFCDFCVRSVRESAIEVFGTPTAEAVEMAITRVLPREDLALFWTKHRDVMRARLQDSDREVISYNFKATYRERLPLVFDVLDGIVAKLGGPHISQQGADA